MVLLVVGTEVSSHNTKKWYKVGKDDVISWYLLLNDAVVVHTDAFIRHHCGYVASVVW